MILEAQFVEIIESTLSTRGWTRSDLARAMGVHKTYVSNYLNGRQVPGPDVMERFFRALDLEPNLSVRQRTPEPV